MVNNNNYNELSLDFSQNKRNLIIHIISISGTGKLFWDLYDDNQINKDKNSDDDNTYYYLNNPGDSISLTIDKTSEIFPLHFINTNPNKEKGDSNIRPGFGFYIYYEIKSELQNYLNLPYSQLSLISLKNTDFPFIFYTKIPDKLHEIDITIKLKKVV